MEISLVKPSEQELIHRAQQGENDAFEALVHEYDQRVLSMATSFTGNIDDAKDVYQEVFIRVYRALPGFEFLIDIFCIIYIPSKGRCRMTVH